MVHRIESSSLPRVRLPRFCGLEQNPAGMASLHVETREPFVSSADHGVLHIIVAAGLISKTYTKNSLAASTPRLYTTHTQNKMYKNLICTKGKPL